MTPVAILLVEDDEILLTVLKTSLEKFFCTVSTAIDADKAIQQIDTTKFDLVLTDLQLGRTSGLEVAQKAKSLLPQALIIMMSGYNDPERIKAAYHCGADEYLVKPFTIISLLKRIRRHGLRLRPQTIASMSTRAKGRASLCQENLHPGNDFLYT